MPSHFKVKEYCPLVFRNLRERFGIDDIDYKESLTRYNPNYTAQPQAIPNSNSPGTSDTLTIIYFFIDYVFIYVYFYPHIVLSGILDPTSHPVVPRFRKPDNYLCSRAQKRPSSMLRRSATAPTGVANMKNETHQESIFHDASEFVKRGLTIKRLRSAEFY